MVSKVKSLAGLVLGILSIPGAIIPLFGFPLSIIGIIFSAKGMKQSEGYGLAIAGLTCSIIGLLLTTANSIWGAYLGSMGKNPVINRLSSYYGNGG